MMALPYLQEQKPGLPVYLHEDSGDVLREPSLNLTSMFGEPVSMDADHLVKDGQILDLLDTEIHCIHVPGHTKGGVCYYFKEQGWLIAGDTWFRQSIGRTDFPTEIQMHCCQASGEKRLFCRSMRRKCIRDI